MPVIALPSRGRAPVDQQENAAAIDNALTAEVGTVASATTTSFGKCRPAQAKPVPARSRFSHRLCMIDVTLMLSAEPEIAAQ